LIVVQRALARAGHHRFEAGRLRHRCSADIERVHHFTEPKKRRVVIETEADKQHLERHAFAHVCKGGAVEIEAECIRRAGFRRIQPEEACLRVDEAADQPGARDAVDPEPLPGCPRTGLVLVAP
jgi:hypothetical protein